MQPLGPHDPLSAGRHRLIALIGQGAMGRVLLGRSPDGRLVAVKMIHRHLARNPEFRARFRMEVQSSQRVTGAYTAAVMDADPDAPEPWLASVFVAGPSLREAIDQSGPMPPGGLRLLTAGLASALMEIHRAGMVHRDLKPSNVLLTDDGPSVIDFGIARALEGDTQLTTTGSLVGSPAFMSPEQAEGRPLTTASDVFSVGAMLLLAATGESPFLGASTPQTLYNVVHNRADTSRVPPVLRAVVDACLDKNPAYRPTPLQLLESVEAVTARPGWSGAVRQQIVQARADAQRWVMLDGRMPEPEKRRQPARGAVIAAAVTLLVAGGATAVLLTRTESAPDPLANKTLELSDEQLRLVDTCQLLGTDVVGTLGHSIEPMLTNSSVCHTQFMTADGKKPDMTVSVGTVLGGQAKESGISVVGKPVLDTTTESRSCARGIALRAQPRIGVEVKIGLADGDVCELASTVLQAVVTRLTTDLPTVSVPKQSVVRLDPCTSVDPAIIETAMGAKADPSPENIHSCTWKVSGHGLVTVRTAEEPRVDDNSRYTNIVVNGGTLGDLASTRITTTSGVCTTIHLVRPTIEDRGELITVMVVRVGQNDIEAACAATESVLGGVVDRLRKY
ncbi:serine/threonine-protein kinase [Nocardia sp. CA-084685]|uniref:serine/threonine-protein kinase n=1 Tax=Nocardia sp. CA-084685 TaxID=3239970 RepID=UPI003D981665